MPGVRSFEFIAVTLFQRKAFSISSCSPPCRRPNAAISLIRPGALSARQPRGLPQVQVSEDNPEARPKEVGTRQPSHQPGRGKHQTEKSALSGDIDIILSVTATTSVTGLSTTISSIMLRDQNGASKVLETPNFGCQQIKRGPSKGQDEADTIKLRWDCRVEGAYGAR